MNDLDLGSTANGLLPFVKISLSLSDQELKKLTERLWCFSSSLRQPRKDEASCNKTPFFERWDTGNISHLTVNDPRYASKPECQKIFAILLALLLECDGVATPPEAAILIIEKILKRKFHPHNLKCFHSKQNISADDIKRALNYSTQRLGAYEIPVSYQMELNQGGTHIHTNVGWMKPLHINYQLRECLKADLIRAIGDRKAIKNFLDKIQVKAYCTDKVTIPPHYSNRDFRWATWPNGIQYASHYQCAMIELELMAQLYEFENAPNLAISLLLEVETVRGRNIVIGHKKCFVTGKKLNFTDYLEAAIAHQGGKSKYHVGHIVPLTRGGKHTADNIAWASDDGNRIQGNNTIEEIEAKLVDAVEYHLIRDLNQDNPPQVFYDKVEKLWNLLNDIRVRLGKNKIDW